jgi:uncharacterized RDD family membrane protein YckC
MFTIIGGDGKEYGPVTTEQVRNWISAGRANLDTKAKAVGAEEWRRLGDFAEFNTEGIPPVTGVPALPAAQAASLPPGEKNLGGLGARFGAALIDGLIEMLCWLPTSLAVLAVLREQMQSGTPSISEITAAFQPALVRSLPYLAVLVVVQCALLSLRGQSIGKLLLGLRIVRSQTGAPAGFLHAFLLRGALPWLVTQVPIAGRLFWLVDVCFIFGEERRCLHDYIASTKVVKT